MTRGGARSTGLGLTFGRLAAEAQGGRIAVESALGEGATFRVTLRRAGDAAAVGTASPVEMPARADPPGGHACPSARRGRRFAVTLFAVED